MATTEAFWVKRDRGVYAFHIGAGHDRVDYLAVRNEAGFAGRAWEVHLTRVEGDRVVQDRCIEDQLPTRDACATRALRHWQTLNRMRP